MPSLGRLQNGGHRGRPSVACRLGWGKIGERPSGAAGFDEDLKHPEKNVGDVNRQASGCSAFFEGTQETNQIVPPFDGNHLGCRLFYSRPSRVKRRSMAHEGI